VNIDLAAFGVPPALIDKRLALSWTKPIRRRRIPVQTPNCLSVTCDGCGEALTDPDTESVGTEPYTAEDPGRQGQVRGASTSEIANSGAFPGGYVGDSTRVEIAFARELGRPIRYTDPLGYAVVLTRPGLDPVRLGPYVKERHAQQMAGALRYQMRHTQHVEGTVIDVGDYRPELQHLDPSVPSAPYALAEVMDDDEDGDGTGNNFPDLYTRLAAQEGHERASKAWSKACNLKARRRVGDLRASHTGATTP
jgi:hypothetical protein